MPAKSLSASRDSERLLMASVKTMGQVDKILERILRGTSDANIPFDDLCRLLAHLGFQERVRGDHHIFVRDGVEEIMNLQPREGQAKPYQVRQVRLVILRYRLGGE